MSGTDRDPRRVSVDARRQGRQAGAQGGARVADETGSGIARGSQHRWSATMISTEHVIGTRPLVVRRHVKWGDCDPAGVVYTVTFAEYVISAAELFYGSFFGTTPQRAKEQQGFGTPSRALSFDFQRSLRPDEEFDMTVTVADVHSRTYVLDI